MRSKRKVVFQMKSGGAVGDMAGKLWDRPCRALNPI